MTKYKSKIAMIIHSLTPGGMERVMTELANYFSGFDNYEIHLVMFGRSPECFYTLSENVFIHMPNSDFKDSFRIISSVKRLLFVRKKIKQISPISILSFGIHWNNFVILSLMGLNYPIFVSERGSPTRRYSLLQILLRKVLYQNTRGIIAQTNVAKEITQKILPTCHFKVIGNPIRGINKMDISNHRQNIILSVGRLITTKHHDRLINIFSKLIAPDWKLIIVGGDALKEKNKGKLQKLIRDLKLDRRVVLTGEQKDVDNYYLKGKIFAFTSSVEGFPNVIGEALSAGLPVVSYDCVAGPSEMITDGENGFLVPVFDDDLFLKKLQLLIDDEELRLKMSANAPASVEKYSIEKIGQQYLDFILS